MQKDITRLSSYFFRTASETFTYLLHGLQSCSTYRLTLKTGADARLLFRNKIAFID